MKPTNMILFESNKFKTHNFPFLMLLLCVCLLFSSETALRAFHISPPETSKKLVWVFFTDKGICPQEDVSGAMDISDLPVCVAYVEGVLELGGELRVASRWLNGITVEVSESVIPEILQLPYVRSVEPVATYKREVCRPSPRAPARSVTMRIAEKYGMSTAQIQQINVDALHDSGYHGEGIIIALLDTGFDLSHDALRDISVLAEYDFVNDDNKTSNNPPEDDIGQDDHGTEVLSVIAGNSPGNLVGVAYAAEYLLAKTERISQKGTMFEREIEEDWWIAGLEWAEINGADVISSSLGYSDWYSYSDMDGATAKTTIAARIAIEKGLVVVVSAGNEGKSRDWPYITAPADGFDVIAVGAVNDQGELANFSSIGPTYDGRIKPDVVAMGENTYVVDPNTADEYRHADGTSMATPLVAGTVALLLQALPDIDKPRELVKLLKYTATRSQSPDNYYGWGIINAEAALRYGMSPELMEVVNDWNPINTIPGSDHAILYPNPVKRNSSTGRLNIYSSEPVESIDIYSISGQLIYQRQDMGNVKFFIWDLKNEYSEEIASGIYMCILKNSSGVIDIKKLAVLD